VNRFEELAGPTVVPTRRRQAVRLAAAALSALVAVLYLLIGFGQLYFIDSAQEGAAALIFFGLPAGASFMLGTVLLVMTDRRRLWIAGAAFQVFAIVAYIQVAPRRTPPFEMWGILIKALQVGILAALLYLIVDAAAVRAGSRGPEPGPPPGALS